MNVLVLGKGTTGAAVAQIACDRGHTVRVLSSQGDCADSGLAVGMLSSIDVVIDFTTANAVLSNIKACARAGTNIVVGGTGWHGELATIREQVEQTGIGLLYGVNFSAGLSTFLDVSLNGAVSAQQRSPLSFRLERRCSRKKPSSCNTSLTVQKLLEYNVGLKLNTTFVHEREAAGMRSLVFDLEKGSIIVTHDAKTQRAFAEGTVRAAEWLQGKRGFYDLSHVCRKRPIAHA